MSLSRWRYQRSPEVTSWCMSCYISFSLCFCPRLRYEKNKDTPPDTNPAQGPKRRTTRNPTLRPHSTRRNLHTWLDHSNATHLHNASRSALLRISMRVHARAVDGRESLGYHRQTCLHAVRDRSIQLCGHEACYAGDEKCDCESG